MVVVVAMSSRPDYATVNFDPRLSDATASIPCFACAFDTLFVCSVCLVLGVRRFFGPSRRHGEGRARVFGHDQHRTLLDVLALLRSVGAVGFGELSTSTWLVAFYVWDIRIRFLSSRATKDDGESVPRGARERK